MPASIELTTFAKMNVTNQLSWFIILPANAHPSVVFSSSDEQIASFVDGKLIAHRSGNVEITVKSAVNETIFK